MANIPLPESLKPYADLLLAVSSVSLLAATPAASTFEVLAWIKAQHFATKVPELRMALLDALAEAKIDLA